MNQRTASPVSSSRNLILLAGLFGVGVAGSIATLPETPGLLSMSGLPSLPGTFSVPGLPSTIGTVDAPAPTAQSRTADIVALAGQVAQHAAPAAHVAKAVHDALVPPAPPVRRAIDNHYDQLRTRLNWLPVRYQGEPLKTPDGASRLLLVQAAATSARLEEVGLSHRDVYGIINAETSWIPRLGASKDGTPNLGIAQFEPATAKAMGLRDPGDPVESVHMAALHLKDAAKWSAKRISRLKLTPEQRAQKLREGVSIYYNLSVKGRNQWNGLNTAKLPIETRRHIANARLGAREAAGLELQLRAVRQHAEAPRVMTASLSR